jgi:hypothetical protein
MIVGRRSQLSVFLAESDCSLFSGGLAFDLGGRVMFLSMRLELVGFRVRDEYAGFKGPS